MSAVSEYQDLIDVAGCEFADLPVEVQTDKERKKALPCIVCKRPLITSAFYVPGKARCSDHKADVGARTGSGRVEAPQRGRTDPAKAARLQDCLVNPGFATALCPVHPDDPEHVMVLKCVTHSDSYGPSRLVSTAKGPVYQPTATGESVMLQCSHCKATVSYSTMAQSHYRAQNEPKEQVGDPTKSWSSMLGVRDD